MSDPVAPAPPRAADHPADGAVTPPASSRLTAGRVAMIVVGSVLGLIGICLMLGGGYGLWLHTTQRSGGYVMTSGERFTTGGYALATRTIDVSSDVPAFLYGRRWLGDVRLRAISADPARPLFLGIARQADAERYLTGVERSEVTDISGGPFGGSYHVTYARRPGGAPARPPAGERIWVARTAGRGTQALTWRVRHGRWAVVVMRADGSRGVSAEIAAGAKLPALLWVSLTLLGAGALLLVSAGLTMYVAARERPAAAAA